MFDADATGKFFTTGTWKTTLYRGVPIYKFPTDLWYYHELIQQHQPDLIVELGTARGGSALWFYDQMELAGCPGQVITVDPLEPDPRAVMLATIFTNGIRFIKGSSLDLKVVKTISDECEGKRVLISLDSDHVYSQVWNELDLYAPLVEDGLLVVEDTFLGHVDQSLIPGRYAGGNHPARALADYLLIVPRFTVLPDKFSISMNPGGWLSV